MSFGVTDIVYDKRGAKHGLYNHLNIFGTLFSADGTIGLLNSFSH